MKQVQSSVKPAPVYWFPHYSRLAMAPLLHKKKKKKLGKTAKLKGPRYFSVTKQEIVSRPTNLLFITWSRRAGGVM